jgi:hypothetical protein
MGIKVTYEYECDICKKPVFAKSESVYNYGPRQAYLQPLQCEYIGKYMTCGDCLQSVYVAMQDLFVKNAELS